MDLKSLHFFLRLLSGPIVAIAMSLAIVPTAFSQNSAPEFFLSQADMPQLRKNNVIAMTEDEILTIAVNSTAAASDADLLAGLPAPDIQDAEETDDEIGIAITAWSGNGSLQYLNASSQWVNVPTVSATQLFLLGPSHRLQYVGDQENAETASITYYLWDGTQGTARSSYTLGGATGGTSAFSASTRTSSIPVTAVQDPAELNNVPTSVAGNDDAEVEAFDGITVDDVDRSPADTLTVSITVSPKANGTLSQRGSSPVSFVETGVNTGIYTATGTEANVESALQSLVFQPTPNQVPVGSTVTTGLSLAVSDGQPPGGNDDVASFSVVVTSVNDNPVVTPADVDRFVFTRSTIVPFQGFSIGDADVVSGGGRQTVSLSITEAATTADGSFVLANGSTSTANTITFSALSLEAAIAELTELVYVASSETLASPVTVTLTLVVTDQAGGSTMATADIVVATPNISSNIRNTESDQEILDTGVRRLFENVTITGTDVASLEVVALVATGALAGQNAVTAGAGTFVQTGPTTPFAETAGVLVFSGAASDATTALRALAFKPTPNVFGETETVQFSLTLKKSDSSVIGTDSRTTAHIIPVNDLPTFIKFKLLNPILDSETIVPFETVEIGDADVGGAQLLKVTVDLLSSLPAGTTSDPIPGSLAGTGFTQTATNSGIYVFNGSPVAATTAIQSLVFTPKENRLMPGMNETVTFVVRLDDGSGDVVVRNQVRVLVVSENDTPEVADMPSGRIEVMSGNDITPFGDAGTTLDDVDLGDEITVRIALDSAEKGELIDGTGRFVESPEGSGIYLATGPAAAVEASLQGLRFQLKPGYPVPAGELGITVEFSVTVSDRQAAKVEFSFSLLVRIDQVTRVVLNTNDSGPGSLRQAIEEASDNDHIAFDLDAVFAVESTAVIRLMSPLPIEKNLSLFGPGAEKLVITGDSDDDGTPDVQLFQVGVRDGDGNAVSSAYLHLSYLTLAEGSDAESEFGNGGAVSVGPGSTLILDHAEVLDCVSEQWGGAIDVDDGWLRVSHTLFARNKTGGNLGQGGGAISVYGNEDCVIENVTFSANTQGGAGGIGGGALYFENAEPSLPFLVFIRQCTFSENLDNAGKGSALRTNVFNTVVSLQNCLFSDGTTNPLDPSGAGRIISQGGNVADDDTKVIISQGGASLAIVLLDAPSDRVSRSLPLLDLADNGGQTRTHALPTASAAEGAGVTSSGTATDQRDVLRSDPPDAGAFESGSFARFVINEIHFDPDTGESAFVEVVNPRDSQTAPITGYELWVSGFRRHVFTAVPATPSDPPFAPGTAIIVAELGLNLIPPPPGAVPVQRASVTGSLGLGLSGGIVELRAPDPDGAGPLTGGVVATATYLAQFAASGAPNVELRNAHQSVTRSCEFLGGFLPRNASPGTDDPGIPLLEGNATPLAYDDSLEINEDTVNEIDVLANDFDADRTDVLRVQELPSGQSAQGAALTIVNDPRTGVSIGYDPTGSALIQAIPLGGTAVDTFDYIVVDYINGTTFSDWVRYPPAGATEVQEKSDNRLRATGTVTVQLIGVNDAPEPVDDKPVDFAWLATTEDTLLTFPADDLLDNDLDPDTGEGGRELRICWVKPPGFQLEDKDPTRVELSDLETVSALGAKVILTLRADRSLSTVDYDPRESAVLNALALNEVIEDSFTYLVIDKHGAPGIATVCIRVTGRNDAPVARDDGPFATNEDTAIDILFAPDLLGNDTDVDQNGTAPDDVLSVISADASSLLGATVTQGAGQFVYNPSGSALLRQLSKKEVILDEFNYVIADGNGGTATAKSVVRVTGVNDPPIAADDTRAGAEDAPVTVAASNGVLVNDTDFDMNDAEPEDLLRAVPVGTFTSTLGASVTLYADGSFDYEPNGLFEGLAWNQTANDSFTYKATDDALVYASADAYRISTGETAVFLPVLLNDVNLGVDPSGALAVTEVGQATQGGVVQVAPDGSGVLYTPAFGFVGTETFIYHITAGDYGQCMATVTIEVVPGAGPITGKNDFFTVAPNGTAVLDVLANDVALPGGVSTALTNLGPLSNGGTATIVFQGGRTLVQYSPAAGYTGPESFTYQASAGGGTTFGATVSIAVPSRLNQLRARNDSFYVVSNSVANALPVLANDGVIPATAAGWTIPATQLGVPSSGGTLSVSPDGQRIEYSPAAGFAGVETFTYRAMDAFGGTSEATSVTVTVGLEGFHAMNDSYAVNKNSTSNVLSVLANDVLLPVSSEVIQITFLTDPANGTATWNAARSAIVYTPDPNHVGADSFVYEIGTATHPRRAATVTLNVIDRGGEIKAASDIYCVAGDSRNNVLSVLANDGTAALSTQPLVVSSIGTPIPGSTAVAGSDGTMVLYTPKPGFIGTDTFTYVVSDGQGGTGTSTVTVIVGGIFVGADEFTVVSNSGANLLDVLANDRRLPGGEPELVGVTTPPNRGGAVSLNGTADAFIYTPAANFTGIETFAYAVRNDSNETFQATVTVRVLPVGSDHDLGIVTVIVQGANDSPTLSGVTPIDFLRDDSVVKPFTSVLIGDVDSNGLEILTVKVVIDDPAKGELVYAGPLPAPTIIESPPGTYTFSGTPANVTATIRNLCFVPTDNRIDWSKHETTTLTICISDGIAPEVKSDGTTIEVYNIGQQFADNWIFGDGTTMSWNDRRILTVGRRQPFGLPLGGGGTWSNPYTGEWLLYTDGVTAWNPRTGTPIAGAVGTLGGQTSDSNMIPAMVVPKPWGDPNIHLFVFAFASQSRSIRFTEIDLSLGAAGQVVGTPGREVGGSSNSQQGWVLIPHDNSYDYWLILGNGNAYPVTASGVQAPVTNFNLDGSGASFRYSPDRRRIAVGWSSSKSYVYDFNPSTGVIGSTRIELPRSTSFFEISHDGTKLYVNDTSARALYQYNLGADPGSASATATRSAAVSATEVLLQSFVSPDFAGDMALAPDGRIYIAGEIATQPKLHVIENPDAAGAACGLVMDAVALPAGSILRQGLYHGLRPDDLIRHVPPLPAPFEAGRLASVSNGGWTPVTLDRTFTSMVVVATPEYPNATTPPVMTRIRNASGNSFEVSLAQAGGTAAAIALPVNYVVAEARQYTLAADGIKMEAVRYNSTVTDRFNAFTGQARTYLNSYTNPVVLGQVMTSNDARPSVFWARGSSVANPPVGGSLFTGKHIGADSAVPPRAAETIGYIVMEAGQGSVRGIDYTAFTGADSIQGLGDAPPYTYSLSGVATPKAAVLSSAAMDDLDGGWPVLFGATPVTPTALRLAINEDQYADTERNHSTEQVAVLVVGNSGVLGPLLAGASASLDQWRQLHFSPAILADPEAEATHWGLEADADADGRTNMQEYAFGSDPWHEDDPEPVRLWIERDSSDGDAELTLSHLRRSQDGLIRYVIETSSNLLDWEPAASRLLRSETFEGSGYESIIQRLGVPSVRPGAFYRVRAVR